MAGILALGTAVAEPPRKASFTVPVAEAEWVLGTRAVIAATAARTPDDEPAARVNLRQPANPQERTAERNSLSLPVQAAQPADKRDWRVTAVSFWLRPLAPSPEPVIAVLRRGYGEQIPLAATTWQRVTVTTWGATPLYLREVANVSLRTALPPEGTAFEIGPVRIDIEERLLRWLPATDETFLINGLPWLRQNDGAYIRLPRRIEREVPKVWNMARHPAGGRVRFRTDSATLRLRVDHGNDGFPWPMMSAMAMAGIELYEGPPERSVFRWVAVPASAKEPYELAVPVAADGAMHEYALYLPMYAKLASLDIGLDPEARIEPPSGFRKAGPVVFYGTSFVQGGCASRGSMNFPAIVGRRLGVDIVNLGFAGDGQCEPQVAECMAEIEASCFVMGPILNNLPLMRERYAPFVACLRRKWPRTPILLMTRLHTVGQKEPYAVNQLVREIHDAMRAAGDRNVHLFDSFPLYGDGGFYPTADGVHPTDHGFMIIANALAPVLAELLELPAPDSRSEPTRD